MAFKLRSGNKTSFKMMGSSPVDLVQPAKPRGTAAINKHEAYAARQQGPSESPMNLNLYKRWKKVKKLFGYGDDVKVKSTPKVDKRTKDYKGGHSTGYAKGKSEFSWKKFAKYAAAYKLLEEGLQYGWNKFIEAGDQKVKDASESSDSKSKTSDQNIKTDTLDTDHFIKSEENVDDKKKVKKK
jgi:hypothetical protein